MTGDPGFGTRDSGFGPHDTPEPAGSRNSADACGSEEAFRLPIDGTLDLHAFRAEDARSLVDEYVRAARADGLTEIRVVHGRGRGVLRGIVQAALEAHPLVECFWDDPASHLGATVAKIRG